MVRAGGRKGAGLTPDQLERSCTRAGESWRRQELYPLWSIPSPPLPRSVASATYRGAGPGRREGLHEILCFSGTTRDVALDTTKSKATHDVAGTPRPVSKMAYSGVIVFWTPAPGLHAEGHRSCLFTSTSVSLSYSGVVTVKFERVV